MTLMIDLPDDEVAALSVRARAQGVSTEQYAQQLLKRGLQQAGPGVAARIRDIWRDMPEDVRAKLPADGARQIDHYVHGLPKRDQ